MAIQNPLNVNDRWSLLNTLLHSRGVMEGLVDKLCETDGNIDSMSFEVSCNEPCDTCTIRHVWWSRKYKGNYSYAVEVPRI